MTDKIKKIDDPEKCKGRHIIIMINNSKLSIIDVGKAVISPCFSSDMLSGCNDYITSLAWSEIHYQYHDWQTQGNYIVFRPYEVKLYYNLKSLGTPVMEGPKPSRSMWYRQSQPTLTRFERNTRSLAHTTGARELSQAQNDSWEVNGERSTWSEGADWRNLCRVLIQ
jgi:hypothetical protein